MPQTALSRLNWDDLGFALRDEQGNIAFSPFTDPQMQAFFAAQLPELPDAVRSLGCIYLPMEQFLSRTFTFPLQHRHHLDAEMLGQELADVAGINPEDWWLSWRSEKVQDGVAGLVFGLPKATQQAMQQQPIWQQTPLLLVDGWERLNYWLDQVDNSEALAVIDADAQGVFFGLFQDGAWQGMRRLNTDMNDETQSRNIAQEVIWSLQAMGMDMLNTQIIGRLTCALADQLPLAHATHPPVIEKALSARHLLNLMLPNPLDSQHQRAKKMKAHRCNIRHGVWKARRGSSLAQTWLRPLKLAVVVSCLWLLLTWAQNMQLEHEYQQQQATLMDIFHTALPNEPNIDILAQLQRAASSQSATTGQGGHDIALQLQYISAVFAQQAWQMQEFKLDQKGVLMAGKVQDLAALNTMRDLLADKLQTDVNIADTDLSGDEVSFRMRW